MQSTYISPLSPPPISDQTLLPSLPRNTHPEFPLRLTGLQRQPLDREIQTFLLKPEHLHAHDLPLANLVPSCSFVPNSPPRHPLSAPCRRGPFLSAFRRRKSALLQLRFRDECLLAPREAVEIRLYPR